MTERNWINSEPGVLALDGTQFRVVYEPDGKLYENQIFGDAARSRPFVIYELQEFVLYRGNTFVCRRNALQSAKLAAEHMQKELEEINA